MTRYIGIDPGKLGAMAVLDEQGRVVQVEPTPMITAAKGPDEYDLVQIRDFLLVHRGSSALFVMLERAQPMPPKMPGGSIANFHRGVGRGWEWMLCALSIPFQAVAPQRWQKVMHEGTPAGDTKQRSIMAAQRLFPLARLQRTERSRVASDGMAEALLLAEYGRRTRTAAPVSVGA